jgi:pimeloyl-ACP methyl ester carboxylesterase
MDATTRRRFLEGALLCAALPVRSLQAADAELSSRSNNSVEYGQHTLGSGVRSRRTRLSDGLSVHFLEAGRQSERSALVVLLHGFPEIAYTWRNQLSDLANAGYHVVAPDLRGYGRTSPIPVRYEDDLLPYSLLNRVSDVRSLVSSLGYSRAHIVGHDWGAYTAAWCGVVMPEVFSSVAMISTPFAGTPDRPGSSRSPSRSSSSGMDVQLAALSPPRKHYQQYCAGPEANFDMWRAPQGLRDFLRAFFYFKSADWKGNNPFPLKSWSAAELAKMPEYYVMQLNKGMAETVSAVMPSKAAIATCSWMTEEDITVYVEEFGRTGFQGGLNYYRISSASSELMAFAGRTLDVPTLYIAGDKEWGPYQSPGALDAMKFRSCTRLLGAHFVQGAGHSVPEEKPDEVSALLVEFLGQANRKS